MGQPPTAGAHHNSLREFSPVDFVQIAGDIKYQVIQSDLFIP